MATIEILMKDNTKATMAAVPVHILPRARMAAVPILPKEKANVRLAAVRHEEARGKTEAHGQTTVPFPEPLYVWDSLYILLVSLPATLLGAALACDGLYWLTAAPICSQASEWLLGAGLATGVVAAADGLIRYVRMGQLRPSKTCWVHVVGNLLALLLSTSNLIYRLNEVPSRAVVPFGITLTATAVCVLIAVAYLGKELPPDLADDDGDDWDLL